MEEFQEADVLWPDAAHHRQHLADQQPHVAVVANLQLSRPVRIPAKQAEARPTRSYDDDDDGLVVRSRRGALSVAEAAGIVPPHVLAARRRCGDERRVASSVCVGQGRTLKGRDLRAVRNAVLHMTGFLGSSDEY